MIRMDETDEDGHPFLEKYLLRKAFDTPDDPYLPDEVLWRQKEQFSDGVGYDWVDGLAKLRGQDGQRRAFRDPRDPLPAEPADHQGVLPPPRDLRGALRDWHGERRLRVRHVPVRQVHRVLHPRGGRLGPGVGEVASGDISGRAVKNVHVAGDKFDLKADGAGKAGNTASTKEKKPAEAASVMAIGGHTRDRGSVAVKARQGGRRSQEGRGEFHRRRREGRARRGQVAVRRPARRQGERGGVRVSRPVQLVIYVYRVISFSLKYV